MSRMLWFAPLLMLAANVVPADEVPEAEPVTRAAETLAEAEEGAEPVAGATGAKAGKEQGPKLISGMSVLGNREAPKSLVIVPWKSSEIGDSIGISPMLDDSRHPVDKEVFMRALSYYEIQHVGRGGTTGVDTEPGRK
jgi:hypothetical protein